MIALDTTYLIDFLKGVESAISAYDALSNEALATTGINVWAPCGALYDKGFAETL